MNAVMIELAAILLIFEVEQRKTAAASSVSQAGDAATADRKTRIQKSRSSGVNDTISHRAGQKREVRK